jgi:hypothetical protein
MMTTRWQVWATSGRIRVVNQRLREADALPVPLGELAAVPGGHVGHVRAGHHGLDARFTFLRRYALDAADEIKILAHRHVGVQRRRLREIARAPLGLEWLIEHVVAGDDRAPLGRRHVAGQHPHRGGLPGAVGAEEAEDLSPFDTEADVVHGRDPAVAFGDVQNLNHVVSPAEVQSEQGACRRGPAPLLRRNI